MERKILIKRHQLELYIAKMKGLSPLDKLSQGFSYVADEKGRTVTDVEKINPGDSLQIYLKNGKLDAKVTAKSGNWKKE